MGVKLVSASGGSVELVAPATATNYTATMPANTGTVITTASTFAGTGPAFSAYLNTNQSLTANVVTKIQLGTEDFDTASCFDSVTNYRFTPNVAGYYQVNLSAYVSGSWQEGLQIKIYKNGSPYIGAWTNANGTTMDATPSLSVVIYMNGSTDYLEAYASGTTGTPVIGGYTNLSNIRGANFSASMVRAA